MGSLFFAEHFSSDSQFFGGWVFCSYAYHSVFCHLQSFQCRRSLSKVCSCSLKHVSPSFTNKYFANSYICDDTIGAPNPFLVPQRVRRPSIRAVGPVRRKNIFFPPPPPPRAFLISPRDLTNARRTSIPHFFSFFADLDCPFITTFFRLFFWGRGVVGWMLFLDSLFFGVGWLRCHAQLLRATQKKRTLLLEMIRVMMPSRGKKPYLRAALVPRRINRKIQGRAPQWATLELNVLLLLLSSLRGRPRLNYNPSLLPPKIARGDASKSRRCHTAGVPRCKQS